MFCHVKDCISQRNRQNFSSSSHNKRRKTLHIKELQKPHIFCSFHAKIKCIPISNTAVSGAQPVVLTAKFSVFTAHGTYLRQIRNRLTNVHTGTGITHDSTKKRLPHH